MSESVVEHIAAELDKRGWVWCRKCSIHLIDQRTWEVECSNFVFHTQGVLHQSDMAGHGTYGVEIHE